MKTLLLSVTFTLISLVSFAQIGVIENFDEGIPEFWTSDEGANFFVTDVQSCTTNSIRANVWGTGGSSTTTLTTENYEAQSNGTDLNISFEYKIVDWSGGATVATPAGWGFFDVEYSTDGGDTWVLLETIDDDNHVTSNECATLSYTIDAVDIPQDSDFQFRIFVEHQAGDFWFYLDNFNLLQTTTEPPNCDAVLNQDGLTDFPIDGNISWSAATGLATEYFLTVGTTPGGNDVVDNVSTGLSTSFNFDEDLDYESIYYVSILPSNENGNADDVDCQEFSFTTEDDPSQTIGCSDGPFNGSYCYGDDENITFDFASDDGSNLNLNFNAGNIEQNFDNLIVFDSDGSVLYNFNDEVPGFGNFDVSGLNFQSSGDTISFQITSDGLISCDSSATYFPIEYSVSCATCVNPQADFELVSDCQNAPQFFVDVDITDLGDANSLEITDDQDEYTETVTETGVVQIGPFDNGTDVVITVQSLDDVNCAVSSPVITQDICSEVFLDCDDGPITETYCYDNNEDYEITFVSDNGGPLNININAGFLEVCCDTFEVLDTDGTVLFNEGGDISGNSFQSTGDELTVLINSDGSVNCQGNNYEEIEYTVSCATCINPQVDYEVVGGCDVEDEDDIEFFVDVIVQDIGDAESLLITNDFNEDEIIVENLGTYTFGPFASEVEVSFVVANQQDSNCVVQSGILQFFGCDCFFGEPFCAPEDGAPLVFDSISDGSAAPEGIDYGCLGLQPNPVWFYLLVEESGDLEFLITQSTQLDEEGFPDQNNLIDVDFIAWGPFENPEQGCANLSTQNQVDCSYSIAAEEEFNIVDAEEGEVYVVLITNFDGADGFISFGQVNQGEEGSGSTNCDFIFAETGCESEGLLLESEVEGADAYAWFEVLFDEEGEIADFVLIDGEDDSSLFVEESGTYRLLYLLDPNIGPQEEFFDVLLAPEVELDPEFELLPDELTEINFCEGDILNFDATPVNLDDYQEIEYEWLDQNGEVVSTDPNFTIEEIGQYALHITTFSSGFGTGLQECLNTFDFTVQFTEFDIDLGGDQEFCDAEEPQTITANVQGDFEGEVTYEWNTGETTQSIEVSETNIYTVTIDIDGCIDAASVEYIFNESPIMELPEEVINCDLTNQILDATPQNTDLDLTLFQWFLDGEPLAGENLETINLANYGHGLYEVEAFSDSEECIGFASTFVGTQELSIFVEDATDNLYCVGESLTLVGLADGMELGEASNVTWLVNGQQQEASGFAFDFEVGSVTGTMNDIDRVRLVVGECEAEIDIERYPIENCIVPQGLSPGGMNPSLDLRFLNDRSGISRLQIFNRYGRKVFQQNNYENNFVGQDEGGNNLVTGTYFLVIRFAQPDPVYGSEYKGWLYINREQ